MCLRYNWLIRAAIGRLQKTIKVGVSGTIGGALRFTGRESPGYFGRPARV